LSKGRGVRQKQGSFREAQKTLKALLGGDLWSGGVKLPYRGFR
jgi:hypothetical protein